MTISRRDGSDGVVVLGVKGDLILTSCPRLDSAVEAALGEGARRVVVDLGEATHVDMPGFALLVRLDRACRAADAEIVVAALPDSFREVSEALCLPETLTMTDDVEGALDPTA